MAFDYEPLRQLSKSKIKGIRAWEYGLLMSFLAQQNSTDWEVLDVGPGRSRFPLFFKRYAKRVEAIGYQIGETLRILKKNGYFYLTTDLYLPDRQEVDDWSKRKPGGNIWSAFTFGGIEQTFLPTILNGDFELVGRSDYNREQLIDNPDRSTYRGRYFTTAAFLAKQVC